MKFVALSIVSACISAVSSLSIPAHRETLDEAAQHVKDMVYEFSTGTMATVFPEDSVFAGQPFALMEYHAPCHPSPSLTFLLMPISRSVQNIMHSPGHRATYTIQMSTEHVTSPMSRGRVAFVGNVTFQPDLPADEAKKIEECYVRHHPDAKWWLPNGSGAPHASIWARFDPEDIYYVGGFGNTHYIGNIPVDLYDKKKPRTDMAPELSLIEQAF